MEEEKQDTKEEPTDQLLKLGDNLICGKDNHYFVYKSGTEVACKKCPLGYPISPGTECKNGHLYIHGEKIL